MRQLRAYPDIEDDDAWSELAMEQAFFLRNSRITQLGEDFLIESEVADRVHGHC